METLQAIGARFAQHISQDKQSAVETVVTVDEIVTQGLLKTTINISKLLSEKLGGQKFNIGDSVVVTMPQNTNVVGNRGAQTLMFIGEKPVAVVDSLIDVSATIGGFKVTLDQVDVILEGFPDFKILLSW